MLKPSNDGEGSAVKHLIGVWVAGGLILRAAPDAQYHLQ
jgi:hypothetical protein